MTTTQIAPHTAAKTADLRAAVAQYRATIIQAELATLRSELETLAILGGPRLHNPRSQPARGRLSAFLSGKAHR